MKNTDGVIKDLRELKRRVLQRTDEVPNILETLRERAISLKVRNTRLDERI